MDVPGLKYQHNQQNPQDVFKRRVIYIQYDSGGKASPVCVAA